MVKENTMKQTVIGLVPYNWDIKTIEEVITEISMGPFGSDIKVSNFVDKGVPVLNGYNVSSIKLKSRHSNFVSNEKAKNLKKAVAKRGDIVVTHRGTIGQIAYIPQDAEYKEYVISQSQFRFTLNKKRVIPEFLVYFFHSNKGQNIITETKGHTGVPAIAQATTTFKKISIPLPPIPEQEAIAEALSDADAWIERLEQLIAKKRLIKEGAMQELLTSKEDWEVKKLGDACEIFKGKGISKGQLVYDGAFECILYGELFTKYKEVIQSVQSKTNVADSISSKIGDLLFPGSTTTSGIDLAKASALMKDKVLLGGDIIVLRKSKYEYNSIFLAYFLNEKRKFEIAQTTKGITIHHLYGSDLSGIYVAFPSLTEQTRIASILSDMDAELEALEAQLGKARKVKQGMMQELLTGKIRLI